MRTCHKIFPSKGGCQRSLRLLGKLSQIVVRAKIQSCVFVLFGKAGPAFISTNQPKLFVMTK